MAVWAFRVMRTIYVFQVVATPPWCVGPALLPTDVCVLEVAEVEPVSAAPIPACGVVFMPMDSVDLDLSMTTAVLSVISAQEAGKHWPTVVTSTVAVSLAVQLS